MEETEQFQDVMVLGAGHSIMMSSVPKNFKASQVNEKFYENSKVGETLNSFGLFGGTNYHTYYPEVTPEEYNPQEDEFIEPLFRMLSACVVAKKYNPTDFSKEGVLKKSMSLLVGQTVNCDHETDISNAIGAVKEVIWQEEYKENGKVIPAGINAVLKIDGKSNPRIARGINMDPPSIHSNSVTVQFTWEPSHKFDDIYEFYHKLGTYDDQGELVRRIVTKIIGYTETSLVSHGADPFAQKITKEGKLQNIVYAQRQYYGAQSNSEEEVERATRSLCFNEFKNFEDLGNGLAIMHNTGNFNNKGGSISQDQEHTQKSNNNNIMNEDVKQLLESLFSEGLLGLKSGEELSIKLTQTKIRELINSKNATPEGYDTLKEQALVGVEFLKQTRASTLELYQKLSGNEPDEHIVSLINDESTNLKTLQSLGASYSKQLQEKFPMKCSACGSHDVSRASSVAGEDGEGSSEYKQSNTENVEDTIGKIARSKHK